MDSDRQGEFNTVEYIDTSDAEWDDMWSQLASDSLNDGDQLCIHQGQSWEYMGSTEDHHHLRHANHPRTEQTEYMYIERCRASISWAS